MPFTISKKYIPPFLNPVIGGICILFLFACKQNKKELALPRQPPNIILIVADDLGFGDLGCYGQQKFNTPHIDQLADEGIRFTQFYAGAPVCAPSRAALMTGLHTGHTYIRGNKEVQPEGQYPLEAGAYTLAEGLKESGYSTAAFGKWGLGYPGSEGDPNHQGVDEFFGYNCQRMAHNYYPEHLWKNQSKLTLVNNAGDQTESYAPEIIHQQALSFIKKNKDSTFFLLYASPLPHAELLAPERLMAEFRGRYPPETPYKGVDEGPDYKKGGYGSQPEPHAAFAAMVSLLDEQVGEVRALVKQLGLSENTLILFTSDNGPHREGGADPDYFDSNGPLRGYKRDVYEGGIRVPLIASWPGTIPAGATSGYVAAFWDLFPTLMETSGSKDYPDTDGTNFLPTLLGQQQESTGYLYWEFHEQGGKQAVRTGPWKGVRLQLRETPNPVLELYNLEDDPGESEDVAGAHPEIVKKIEVIMKEAHLPSEAFPFEGMDTPQHQGIQ